MQINVTVQLAEDDDFKLTAEEVAAAVLAVVGDAKNDTCTASVTPAPQHGAAGPPPPAPELPPPPEVITEAATGT